MQVTSLRTAFIASAMAGVASVGIAGMLQGVPSDPTKIKPIKEGAKLPDVGITNLQGKKVKLKEAIGGKRAVLVFYRGGWCPFCNTQLAGLRTLVPELKKRDVKLIAISPDRPEELAKSVEKNKLDYALYSDSSADAIRTLGLAFRVDDKTYTMYRDQYKIDLEKSSGQTHHLLPVPAVLVVEANGTVSFVHANPDYKERLEPEAILEALEVGR